MAIIELENIFFSYGDVQALTDVSLALEEGIYGLLGPNGAGKTTLMRILLGFLLPQSGRGSILGYSFSAGQREARRQIGYMPESDCLIPGMDAVSLTAYLGELSGMPRQEAMKRAHDVLYYVGLEESRYRKVETYSTGMKQRLKLAQALVHDPDLLLLDEPTSGMDPTGRSEILELIRDIVHKEAMSIIISSHLLADIESTCREVLIMSQGRIIARNAAGHFRDSQFQSYEVRLQGPTEPFLEKLRRQNWQIEEGERGLYRFWLPVSTSMRALFQAAQAAGVQIRHWRRSQESLEDVFLKAIGEPNDH